MLAEVEQAGYRLRVREVGSTSLSDLLIAVADGVGVALLPLSLKFDIEAGGIVIQRGLEPPPRMADVVIAWPANAPRQLRAALAVVREVAHEIRKGKD